MSAVKKAERPKNQDVHPIWRGIGCLMMVILPVLSYALAVLSVNYGMEHNWPIPYWLLGAPSLPAFIWDSPQLAALFLPVLQMQNLYAHLFFGFIYLVLLGGLYSVVYSAIYRVIGPPRYGPTDMPPSDYKPKKYVR